MIPLKELTEFERHLQKDELSANSIENYLRSVEMFFEFADKLTTANVIEWKASLAKSFKPRTVNLRLNGIRRYIEWKELPIKIKSIKEQKVTSIENVISVDQFNQFVQALRDDGKEKYAIFLLILGKTGARISEFLAMKKSDLDRGYAEMHTKGKIRRIYFPEKLIVEIKDFYADYSPDDPLAVNRYGKIMTSRGVAELLKHYGERYGLPKEILHPHSFRHMFAIEFLKRNNNISLLADLMGHSNIGTTMIYLRMNQHRFFR